MAGRRPRWALTSTHLLVLAVAAVALLLLFAQQQVPPAAPGLVPLWALPLLFAAGEAVVVHVALRSDRHTFSMTEIPLVLGVLSAASGPLTLARLAGSLVVLVALRQRGVKLAFNIAQYALEVQVVLLVSHHLAGGGEPDSLRSGLALVVACSAAAVVSAALIVLVVRCQHGGPLSWRGLGSGLVTVPLNASIGVLCVVVLLAQPWAAVVLLVLGAVLQVTLRRSVDLLERHTRLRDVGDFTRRTNEVLDVDDLTGLVLDQARTLLRARHACLVLDLAALADPVAPPAGPADIATTGPAGEDRVLLLQTRPAGAAPEQLLLSRDTPLVRLLLDTDPVTAPAGADGGPAEQLRTVLDARDAVAAPLLSAGRRLGAIALWDRTDDISTFGASDLDLLASLAGAAATSLNTSDLVERLRRQVTEREHEATHDSLSGLPNRRALHERLDQVLEHGTPQAVLLLDLDGFKEINDTLGHSVGDLVLQLVAGRLVAGLPSSCFVARLGGDEYAVVAGLAGEPHELRARGELVAQQVLQVFAEPFDIQDMRLTVRTSIGVALAPEHGSDRDLLLQRADVAMYAAKAAGSGYALYDEGNDPHQADRLNITTDLLAAVQQGQIVVHYQPKAALSTGRMVGAEALARWHHPTRGMLSPDVFIPLAEASGIIHELTLHVLDAALRQCALWRVSGHELTVAVNLSVRSLLDPALTVDVATALQRHGLPAQALVLEVTEGSVMSDLARGTAVLQALADLGVGLAVDDFGTGYSSLAYLRRLPIHEVKIDKSFVLHLDRNADDAAIVRAVVDLGHNLGLRVVAEGVETPQAWELLRDLGCDVAQGYLFGRPVDAAQFQQRLQPRAPAVSPATVVPA